MIAILQNKFSFPSRPTVCSENVLTKPRGFGRGKILVDNMNALNISGDAQNKPHTNGCGPKIGSVFGNNTFSKKETSNNDIGWNEDAILTADGDSRGSGTFRGFDSERGKQSSICSNSNSIQL